MSAEAELRRSVLRELISFSKPVDIRASTVGMLSCESPNPDVVLNGDYILSVLARFEAGELSEADVELSAELIECREDIDYQSDKYEEILEAIYVLANPVLNGSLVRNLDDVRTSLSAP